MPLKQGLVRLWTAVWHRNSHVTIASDALVSWRTLLGPLPSVLTVGSQSMVAAAIHGDRPGSAVEIGARSFIGRSTIVCAERVTIGDDVLVSWGCVFTDHDSHSTDWRHRARDVVDWRLGKKDWSHVRRAPVTIRDKAWLGFNCIVLKGVTIGEAAVVAAGSVVVEDVPAFTVVAGNPARVVKTLDLSRDEARRNAVGPEISA